MRINYVIEVLEQAKAKLIEANMRMSEQVQDLYREADSLTEKEAENDKRIKEIDETIENMKNKK